MALSISNNVQVLSAWIQAYYLVQEEAPDCITCCRVCCLQWLEWIQIHFRTLQWLSELKHLIDSKKVMIIETLLAFNESWHCSHSRSHNHHTTTTNTNTSSHSSHCSNGNSQSSTSSSNNSCSCSHVTSNTKTSQCNSMTTITTFSTTTTSAMNSTVIKSFINCLQEVVENSIQLFTMATRHYGIYSKQDATWCDQQLQDLMPITSCLEYLLYGPDAEMDLYCGGDQYVNAHIHLVAIFFQDPLLVQITMQLNSMSRSTSTLTSIESNSQHHTTASTTTKSRNDSTGVPKFRLKRNIELKYESSNNQLQYTNVCLPYMNHIVNVWKHIDRPSLQPNGTRCKVTIKGFILHFHPLIPVVIQTNNPFDVVHGCILHGNNQSHKKDLFQLKAMEVRIVLGMRVYNECSIVNANINDMEEQIAVFHSTIVNSTRLHSNIVQSRISPMTKEVYGTPPYLVEFQRGNIPVLISVPHGGSASSLYSHGVWQREHLKMRTKRNVTKRFTLLSDSKTAHIGAGICKELAANTGHRPYLILAKFHRKYIDVNRAYTEDAFENEDSIAKRIYERYHSILIHALQEIWLQFPQYDPLLLDIHGQKATSCDELQISSIESKSMIYIGTRHGDTLHSRCNMYRSFLHPLHSILLEKQYLGIYPSRKTSIEEEYTNMESERPEFAGGYIVRTYGYPRTGVNAIQLELGVHLRGVDSNDDFQLSKLKRRMTTNAIAYALQFYLKQNSFY